MIVSSDVEYWLKQANLPLPDRIGKAPEELLAYVAKVNKSTSADQLPAQAELNPDFLNDIRAAIVDMPPPVLQLLDKPLLGVYLGRGLGSSAVTDVVAGPDGKVLGLVTLMDADAFLGRTANDWASWKENTPFLTGSAFQVHLQIETVENDNRKNAMQFLLLHEFGHVMTANSEFLPDWWIGSQKFKSTEEYSFLSLSWQIAMNGDIIPLLRHDFEHRKNLHFYSDQQVAGDLIPDIYKALEKTGFSSLYAATNAYDDFAEAFAMYVHSVMMGKPYRLSIRSGDEIIMEVADYWSSPRARSRKQLFAEYLGN
ncbi:hypothetical protein UNDKW_1611 [Undibacterium sp. KW1]|uniref:hypothetical protein n=1 Tax=Undibacterium sp. KW1 TaxID=2058624 RepID=UPI001331CD23|nr:hypothetical protein [Undibacterium sp. KW1]BBB59884.1 hypothetical protein UNDKW_1611 [Undibacterium sp. KW1]